MKSELRQDLSTHLQAMSVDAATSARWRMLYYHLETDRVDQFASPELVSEIQKWALGAAKNRGAKSAREAMEMIRGSGLTDQQWREHGQVWDFLWPSV